MEKPKPPRSWNHTILQAINYGFACVSTENPYNKFTNYSEDCLTLNLIRPSSPSPDPAGYPIIIWIFGETFESGTSSNFGYQNIIDNLVSRGIIFISFNYRLGPFGFFTSGNELAKGNFGLWDQLEALKFVNKIGSSFGGNLNKITLFGESAGAASISWLTLNSEATKYFSQAFIMSGSVESGWAHSNITIRFSRSFIALLGCDENLDVMSCMKKKTIQDIQYAAKTVSKLAESEHYYSILFHPWFDNDFVKANTVEEAIRTAPKINILMSLNSQEAIPWVFHSSSPLYLSQQDIATFGSSNFTESVKKLLDGEHCFGENQEKVAQKIIEFYQAQSLQYSQNAFLQTYVQLLSDIQFNVPFIREALKRSENGQNVFVFRNSYVSDKNRNFIVDGVGHGSELDIFFGNPPLKGSTEEAVQKRFSEILMNFVKLGYVCL
uniref:Carboxylic ester hydrolase n=1 Tax=Panagrolaimus davidi TaxID=227884 RepID=A0A914QCU2_9BILA